MAFDAHEWGRRWSPGSGPTKGDDVAALYAEDAERWDPSIGSRISGKAAITAFANGFLGALPDSIVEMRSITDDGTRVVVEWTWRGTHTGDMEGWPARGESVELIGINVLTIVDGLIAGENSYWDSKQIFGA